MIKKLVWYFNLYWKHMCTVENNDNKMNFSLPPCTVFLIAEKLPSLLRFWNFQTFSLFYEKLRVIAWGDYFVLQINWKWVEKNIFLILRILTTFKPKWSKIFYNKCSNKSAPIKTTLTLAKSWKAKKKYN